MNETLWKKTVIATNDAFKLEYSVEEKIYNRFHSAEFEVIPWRFLV